MAEFATWKHENLVAFAEAASARLKEVNKQIATERQLAYEWGFNDGRASLVHGGQKTAGAGALAASENNSGVQSLRV